MPPASLKMVGTTRTPPARSRLNTSARVLVAALDRLRSTSVPFSAPSECEAGNGNYLLDPGNAAVIRTIAHLRALSKRAGLRVVDAEQQFGFPKELHDVRMYLLMP